MRIREYAASVGLALAFMTSGSLMGDVDARELRVASGMAPATVQTQGVQVFAERLTEHSGGELTARVFPGDLLSLTETLVGLRDGVVDVGFTVTVYHRGEFPQLNLVTDLAVAGDDPAVLTAAASEYILQCQECIDEMVAQNQLMLGTGAIPTYQLMTGSKVSDIEDFSGLRVRSFSSNGRWVESLGGQMVTLPAGDIYEALSQRQIDGNVHPAEMMRSMSFYDHANYLLDLGVGAFIGNSYVTFNLDVWRELSDQHKEAALRAAADGLAFAAHEFIARNDEVLNNLDEIGVELVEPSPELVEATERFRAAEIDTVARLNAEEYGIHDAGERAALFLSLIEKWEGILGEAQVDSWEDLGEIYWQELFSKVDLTL